MDIINKNNIFLFTAGMILNMFSSLSIAGCYYPKQPIPLTEEEIYIRYALIKEILPDNFVVTGDLDLENYKIIKLPKGLTVKGNLDLRDSNITKLPDNLSVGGELFLSKLDITELPENLSVEEGLDVSDTKITKLPDNFTVGGYLILNNTRLTELPDNLSVGGNFLHLDNSDIKLWTHSPSWGGSLKLSHTRISKLPKNLLSVSGDLDLSGTLITELPDNLSVKGDLDLSDTPLTKLPDNLSVEGDLDLRGSKITKLPNNLTVGGDLLLKNTGITELPDNISVGKRLFLDVKKIKNIVYCENCSNKNITLFATFVNGKIQLAVDNDFFRNYDLIFLNSYTGTLDVGYFVLNTIEAFETKLALDETLGHISKIEAKKLKQSAMKCVQELMAKRNNH